MKRISYLMLICCLQTTALVCNSPEESVTNNTESVYKASPKPKPETNKPELSDEERDGMLITSGVGILSAVVSIFIDRHNISHVKAQLFALLAGLQQFVSYMVRSPLTQEQEEHIVEELLKYLEEQWESNKVTL